MSEKVVKIAIIGFGTVGSGVVKLLQENAGVIARKTALRIQVAHVVDTDLKRSRPVALPDGILHDDLERVLADDEVTIAVELIGGTDIACEVQKRMLQAGKIVVTANKALLAERGEEIYQTARRYKRCVAFEASCCGGIPLIGAIRSGLASNKINAIYGIVNGTCNYILSEMSQAKKEYNLALKEAQEAGYAEADPTLDVNGSDSAHKLVILAQSAFGQEIRYDQITTEGIEKVKLVDINFGQEMGYTMKLLAIAEQTDRGLALGVHPSFISQDDPLAKVSGPFNAVSVFGNAVGHTSYYGPGAGMMPTASAVVADIIDAARGNAQSLFDVTPGLGRDAEPANLCPPGEISRRFYLRLSVMDRPGVFAQIARILGDREISILACLQHESRIPDSVPLVILTHRAPQGNMDRALQDMARLNVVKATPICIHVVTPPNGTNGSPAG